MSGTHIFKVKRSNSSDYVCLIEVYSGEPIGHMLTSLVGFLDSCKEKFANDDLYVNRVRTELLCTLNAVYGDFVFISNLDEKHDMNCVYLIDLDKDGDAHYKVMLDFGNGERPLVEGSHKEVLKKIGKIADDEESDLHPALFSEFT